MKNGALTYGQLHDKLKSLGFRQRPVEVDGKRGEVFEHRTLDNAMIVLPERNRNDVVEPFFMNSVLATLKAHELRGFE